MRQISFLKKASLSLAVVTLLLGVLPLPLVGQVGAVFAQDEAPPANEADEAPPTSEPGEAPVPETVKEKPKKFDLPAGMSSPQMMTTQGGPIGDDPAVAGELPDFGNNYNNGDCVTNAACETATAVTNPNDYTDMGGYGKKEYVLPTFSGNDANIVAIKDENNWYFFKKGSSETCTASNFCVEFDDDGNVSVYSYNAQGRGYEGYQMIHFWFVDTGDPGGEDPGGEDPGGEDPGGEDPGGEDPGVTTLTAPPAAGAPAEELLLIPVTGVDATSALAAAQGALRSMSLFLFGLSIMAEGLRRKKI